MSAASKRRDVLFVAIAALVVRLAVALYGAGRFPPADDGTFYHVVASRIARGFGYTWLWPDGAVTYAAHYPVGYPALLAAGYAVFGAHAGVAMLTNAVFGALAAVAVQLIGSYGTTPRGGLVAGALVAFEPALVLYTPALMTEGVAGGLLVVAAALSMASRPSRWFVRAALAGVVLGVAVLVRPELVLLAPVIGSLATRKDGLERRLLASGLVLAASLAVCAPWTIRNCVRLERCAFVSVNGGWNLYIGSSPLGRGGFAPIDQIGVPEECRTVFGEADKDACFGRAGVRVILRDPGAWLAQVPQKLGATFNYGTAAAHYLSASNPALVGERAKTIIGATELTAQRLLLLVALFAAARAAGPRSRVRAALAGISAVAVLLPFAWVAWVGFAGAAALLGRALFAHPALLLGASSVAVTTLVHAVFFGASRYTLVCLPALAACAGTALVRPFDSEAAGRG